MLPSLLFAATSNPKEEKNLLNYSLCYFSLPFPVKWKGGHSRVRESEVESLLHVIKRERERERETLLQVSELKHMFLGGHNPGRVDHLFYWVWAGKKGDFERGILCKLAETRRP